MTPAGRVLIYTGQHRGYIQIPQVEPNSAGIAAKDYGN
jgi:hypothetical protein